MTVHLHRQSLVSLFITHVKRLPYRCCTCPGGALDRRYLLCTYVPITSTLPCKIWIQADCTLRVRHSLGLIKRNAKWFVSEEEVEYVYLGRHVLASLGLDNQEFMTGARSRLGVEVDATKTTHRQFRKMPPPKSRYSSASTAARFVAKELWI